MFVTDVTFILLVPYVSVMCTWAYIYVFTAYVPILHSASPATYIGPLPQPFNNYYYCDIEKLGVGLDVLLRTYVHMHMYLLY